MKFSCPHCTQKLEVDDNQAGGECFCPSCSQPLVIPSLTSHEVKPLSAARTRGNGLTILYCSLGVAALILLSVWIAKESREVQARKEAARQAKVEQERQQAHAKDLLRAAVKARCPDLGKYVAEINAGRDTASSVRRSINSVLKDNSSMLESEIAFSLAQARKDLDEARTSFESKAPAYIKSG